MKAYRIVVKLLFTLYLDSVVLNVWHFRLQIPRRDAYTVIGSFTANISILVNNKNLSSNFDIHLTSSSILSISDIDWQGNRAVPPLDMISTMLPCAVITVPYLTFPM